MPVTTNHESSRLALSFLVGTNAQGNPLLKVKNLARVRPTATDADVYEVATALAGLQAHTLNNVGRVNNLTLESN